MKKINKLLIVILILTFLKINFLYANNLENYNKTLKKYNIEIDKKDILNFKEVINFWEKYGKTIWPKANFNNTAYVIVFAGKHNIVFNHKKNLKDSIKLTDNFPYLNTSAQIVKDHTFMSAGAACNKNFHGQPAIFVNRIKDRTDYVRTYAKKNNYKQLLNYTKPINEYAGEILHELFHSFQYTQLKNNKKMKKKKPIRLTKIDYPYLNKEINIILGIEGRILKKIINTKDNKTIEQLIKDFWTVRKKRHSLLDNDLIRLEKYMESSEGTAQYVGYNLQFAKNMQIKEFYKLNNANYKKEFGKKMSLIEAITTHLDKLHMPTFSRYMLYVYITGLAQSYILNNLSKDWQKDFFLTKTSLKDVFLELYPDIDKNNKTYKEIKKLYFSDKMKSELNTHLQTLEKVNYGKYMKFRSNDGYKFIVKINNAKQKNLLFYAPVLLTEYNNYRIFEAGVSQVEYRNDKFKKVSSIKFSKPIPVLNNLKNGEFTFYLKDKSLNFNAKNIKKVGKSKILKDKVEVKSEYFNFNCEKLIINENNKTIYLKLYN